MITKEEMNTLEGWKQSGAYANGGTLVFAKDKRYSLDYNATNFIYLRDNDPKLTEIKIKMVYVAYDETKSHKRKVEEVELYKGHPANIEELKEVFRVLMI